MNPTADGSEPKGVLVAAFEADRVALALRGKQAFFGFWSLPGGSRESGETLEQAARRELFEEVGLKAEILIHAGLVELSAPAAESQRSQESRQSREDRESQGSPQGRGTPESRESRRTLEIQRSRKLIESFGPVALFAAAKVSGSLRGGGDALEAAWFSRADFVEAKAIPKTLDLVEKAARRIEILF